MEGGPISLDILANFTERWRQQAPDQLSRLMPITGEEFAVETAAVVEEGEEWSVQLFRSITSDSVSGTPTVILVLFLH